MFCDEPRWTFCWGGGGVVFWNHPLLRNAQKRDKNIKQRIKKKMLVLPG
jgi:hypothetical protein